MVAAAYYGIKPWELAEQANVWTEWALIASSAEKQAMMERLGKMLSGGKKS